MEEGKPGERGIDEEIKSPGNGARLISYRARRSSGGDAAFSTQFVRTYVAGGWERCQSDTLVFPDTVAHTLPLGHAR